jgi:3-hydroxyisobutyrate dehydrogenase
MLKIGFIGLGNMGLPMSVNLDKIGYKITAFDKNRNIAEELKGTNIEFVDDISLLAKNKDVIITMLPNGEIVKNVYKSFINFVSKNTLLIDCSTIDIETTKLINLITSDLNLSCLDAPVSGGVIGAVNGTLTFMVGGKKYHFEQMKPLFDAMGSKAILCGNNSSGQLAKICNNLVLAISMIGVGEAFNLAKKSSLDLNILYDVMSTSTASCWAINSYCPVQGIGPQSPADDNYKAGFSVNLMAKDLNLALQAINQTNISSPLGKIAEKLYYDLSKTEMGKLDFSSIFKAIEENKL